MGAQYTGFPALAASQARALVVPGDHPGNRHTAHRPSGEFQLIEIDVPPRPLQRVYVSPGLLHSGNYKNHSWATHMQVAAKDCSPFIDRLIAMSPRSCQDSLNIILVHWTCDPGHAAL